MRKTLLLWLLFILSISFIVACANETAENGEGEASVDTDRLAEEFEEEKLVLEQRILELEQVLEQKEAQIAELMDDTEGSEEEGADVEPLRPVGEGFYEQHWMYQLKHSDNELGFEPGSLDWRDYTGTSFQGFSETDSTYTETGMLVYDWLDEVNINGHWGELSETAIRVRLQDEESAEAIILQWGLKDDSIYGIDYLLQLQQSDGNWFIESVQERYHCGRGVSGDLCL